MVKISQLTYNEEMERYEFNGEELHCGDCLTVLIFNDVSGKVEWIETRIEHDGSNYYLVGLMGYQISGLFATVSADQADYTHKKE